MFWNFYNCHQFIGHIALLDINIPSNLFKFFSKISPALKYGIIPTYEATKNFISASGDDFNPYNHNFESFGYKYRLFVYNIELPFYLFVLYPFILIGVIFTIYASKRFAK